MDKHVLMELGRRAAASYLDSGTPMSEKIAELSAQHSLNRDQIERVCHFANHAANQRMMDKEAYTDFPLARPADVMPKEEVPVDIFIVDDYEEEKVASFDGDEGEETFSKIARLYGAEYVSTGDEAEDARRFLKAATLIAERAIESYDLQKQAMDDASEAFFNEVSQALMQGVPLDSVQRAIKSADRSVNMEAVLNRLEAEGLIRSPNFEDSGPYSLHRFYKQAELAKELGLELPEFELDEDSAILKIASAYEEASRQLELDYYSAGLALSGLERMASVMPGADEGVIKEASLRANLIGSIAKKSWGAVKGIGKWVGKKPTIRGLGVVGTAGAAGDGARRSVNTMTSPRIVG